MPGRIKENVRSILKELPPGVELAAAAKSRSVEEIVEAVEAGIKIVGENYVREAETAFKVVGKRVKWHFIGHLQKNKVKKAVEIFDMIETLDSLGLAIEINKRAKEINKIMPVLIEVNSGREKQKFGVLPDNAMELVQKAAQLENISIKGLMTMGPYARDPEKIRPCFKETKRIFQTMQAVKLPRLEMKYLSMGMSGSYKVAIEEGANIVRVGTKIFGERKRGRAEHE